MTPTDSPALEPHALRGRVRLAARTTRRGLRAARQGHWDFSLNAVRAVTRIARSSMLDLVMPSHRAMCNMCGWKGRAFYPNAGPGFAERASICPGCLASDRYRSLYEVLRSSTTAFEPGHRVIEVAPLPSLERIFQTSPGIDYTSFDIDRHAMEHGDITQMRFEDESVDWFICFHVLEHLPDEPAALEEIHRVLAPGGSVVLQVPVDWDVDTTREYGAPDPRDVGHVRRHGRDFPERIAGFGFDVERVDPLDVCSTAAAEFAGLSAEPVFIARAHRR